MKDAFGNEIVRASACAHPWCPPWKCMHFNPFEGSFQAPSAEERRREMQGTADKLRQLIDETADPYRRDALEQIVANLDLIAQGLPPNPPTGKSAPPREAPTTPAPPRKKKSPWRLF